jgi:hypothetical integral membrane protein (TIGR02206 family)
VAYDWSLIGAAVVCAGLCAAARWRPGRSVLIACRILGVLLLADVISRQVVPAFDGTWSARSDLPLFPCDLVGWIAPFALWTLSPFLVEWTYFWGLAGGIQAVVTPTVTQRFPHLGFMQYVVLHNGVIVAALVLVVGFRLVPRHGAALRIALLTAFYTLVVGLVDFATGGNYMYLRKPPGRSTLLAALGPWPWYVFGAAGIAFLSFALLDAPFRPGRTRQIDGHPNATGGRNC